VAERLFGVETEYALAGLGDSTEQDRRRLIELVLEAARAELAGLPDVHSGGMFLANGARFYVDLGLHPEFCTPECANPWDVVRYIHAGEEILLSLLERVQRGRLVDNELFCIRTNVDYSGGGATWGCHESYLHRSDQDVVSDEIIPHLVTRIVYTGAGGFNPCAHELEFSLSPRAAHLVSVISESSTENRGIFHTKDESLSSQGYHRLHLLCGESLCSETASWLKVGATVLVVAMIDAGLKPGREVQLESPLEALRTVAKDVKCQSTLRLQRGKPRTAIAIQRHYLEQAEANLKMDFMPPWAPEVCRRWRAMLDLLEGAPGSVARTLDWAIKHALYLDYLHRSGLRWDAMPYWNGVLNTLSAALAQFGIRGLDPDFLLSPHSPVLEDVAALTPKLREHGLRWSDFSKYAGVRSQLYEADTRFGQLDANGIFQKLDRAGVLTHRVPGVDNIPHAIANPPAIGRARLRGETIQRMVSGQAQGRCDWQSIWDTTEKRFLDLSDPFAAEERWQAARVPPREGRGLSRPASQDADPALQMFLDLRR